MKSNNKTGRFVELLFLLFFPFLISCNEETTPKSPKDS